jgi:cytochrome c
MTTRTGCVLISAGLIAGAGNALASEDLARKSGCFACHAIDRKVTGPAFKDIAAKYRGDAGAEARLIKKLEMGGAGAWGEIFMPPMIRTVPEGDIKTLVKWILSIK